MWVEFHSKAHGIWWMSWNMIKKKHENSSKRTLPEPLWRSGFQESYKVVCVMVSSEVSGRDSNKTNWYYIYTQKEQNTWQRRPKHVQNTDNLCKSMYKWFCTSQDLMYKTHFGCSFFFFSAINNQEAIASCHNEIQRCYVCLLFLIMIMPRLKKMEETIN